MSTSDTATSDAANMNASRTVTKVVNGVFEGGGSKGLMYVGALRACEERGIGFAAVAGSSAGAITSMLVSLGYTSTQLEEKIDTALRKLGNPLLAAATLGRRSLLSSSALRDWLAEQLADTLGPRDGADPDHTFLDIRKATRITLYVIAMDLATGQPIVFSPDLTPDASVADAVVASSAIPVAFPSPRVEVDGEVRRLADGGVWSNYPSFVFLDDDFRAAHSEIDDGAEGRDTLGFILDDIKPERVAKTSSQIRATRPNPLGSDRGSAPREFGLFGGFVTSPFGHITICVLPILLAFVGASWFVYELDNGMPHIGRLPDGLEDTAVLALVVVYLFVLIQLAALAIVVIRLGRALADEGLMGTKAALGVGPNVPYWVGLHDRATADGHGHLAVRLIVPDFLSTLKGHLHDSQRAIVVERGRAQTHRTFDHVPDTYPSVAWQPSATIAARDPKPGLLRRVGSGRKRSLVLWVASGAAFCVGFVAMLWLTFDVVREADVGRIGWWQLLTILAILGALELLHIWSRSQRASLADLKIARLPSTVLFALSTLAAIAGVGGAVLLWVGDDTNVNLSLRDRLRVDPVEATAWAIDDLDDVLADEAFDAYLDDPEFDDPLFDEFDDPEFDDPLFDDPAFDEFDDPGFAEFDEDPDAYFAAYDAHLETIGYYELDGAHLYEVDLENFDLNNFNRGGLQTGYYDLDGQPLVRCFRVEDCVVMRSTNVYAFGEPVDVRYNGQNILFFDDDRWRFTFTGTALSVLYLSPLAIGYQLWLLARWKRERELREKARALVDRAAGERGQTA